MIIMELEGGRLYKLGFEQSGEEYCGKIIDLIFEGKRVVSEICEKKEELTPFIKTHLNRVLDKQGLERLRVKLTMGHTMRYFDKEKKYNQHEDFQKLYLSQIKIFLKEIDNILKSRK